VQRLHRLLGLIVGCDGMCWAKLAPDALWGLRFIGFFRQKTERFLPDGGVSRAAKGADCKSADYVFVGSSPTSSTRYY
jgi:hypothetical protein